MIVILRKWVARYLAEEEVLILLLLIIGSLLLLVTIGDVLAPIIASIVLAYMIQGLITALGRIHFPERLALMLGFTIFVGAFLLFLLVLLPLLWNQMRNLLSDLPRIVDTVRAALDTLPQRYPWLVSESQMRDVIEGSSKELAHIGQTLFSFSLAHLPGFLGVAIYLVVVPLLVFFFLKDRLLLLHWVGSFLPTDRPRMRHIWQEMNLQLANYVRGKGIEVLMITAASIISFKFFGMSYAALLGFLVGLSVVIPYVGFVLVTIPVAVVGFVEWGWSSQFGYLMLAYFVVQGLDGFLLVPLLFSEANNLHPVAIILSVLIFGSIWGVWGAFFAIPLANLIKAIMNAWPREHPSAAATLATGP